MLSHGGTAVHPEVDHDKTEDGHPPPAGLPRCSYAWLENLLGCHMRNAGRIVPAWQPVKVGDRVWLHPEAPPMIVAVAEPPRALVLAAPVPPDAEPALGAVFDTWGLYLEPLDERTTRLVARARSDRGRGPLGGERRLRDSFSQSLFWEPAHFLMERKMLLTIKRLAEEAAAGEEPGDERARPAPPVNAG
jgi:hypothetical protein